MKILPSKNNTSPLNFLEAEVKLGNLKVFFHPCLGFGFGFF